MCHRRFSMSGKKREKNRIRRTEKRKSRRLPEIVSRVTVQTESSFKKDGDTEVEDTENIEASDDAREQSEIIEEEPTEAGECVSEEEPAKALIAEHEIENVIHENAVEEEDISAVEIVPEYDVPSQDSPPQREICTIPPRSREIPETCPACKASVRIFRMPGTHNGQKINRVMVIPCNCGNYYGFIDPPL